LWPSSAETGARHTRARPLAIVTMQKALRTILGIGVVGLVLHAADLATRDCRVAPYVYDDCMWIQVRNYLGLPASRLLHMSVMEGVGIVLALILYLTFRYVFPFRTKTRAAGETAAPGAVPKPGNQTIGQQE
jgi:hypothetical protein